MSSNAAFVIIICAITFSMTTCTVLIRRSQDSLEQARFEQCTKAGGQWIRGWGGFDCNYGAKP